MIAFIPFQLLSLSRHRERLFYLVKVVRIHRGLQLFDIPYFMKTIKQYLSHKLSAQCEQDIFFAWNKEGESNANKILYTTFSLKIFQLVLIVFNISYFVGMFWLILCELVEDFYNPNALDPNASQSE